jgi:hypothetical protein
MDGHLLFALTMPDAVYLSRLYNLMRHWISEAGFDWEVAWQRTRSLEALTEQEFLRETAWVILCSGFRASTVKRMFDHISLCFCDWESAAEIARQRDLCVSTATGIFRNEAKIRAIADVATFVDREGFASVVERLHAGATQVLQELPYIGPVTSLHLAKNLGLPTPKPDRHLVRLAEYLSCASTYDLCDSMASQTGEPVAVVDVVLWRFMEQAGPLDVLTLKARDDRQAAH